MALRDFLCAMLSGVAKRDWWSLAEQAGYVNARPFEHLLDGASWDEGVLRDRVRSYLVEHLEDGQAVLVLDDTQVVKKGTASVGVSPQHCGLSGQTENCQALVMLTYASDHGHGFIDRALYMPHSWMDAPERLKWGRTVRRIWNFRRSRS